MWLFLCALIGFFDVYTRFHLVCFSSHTYYFRSDKSHRKINLPTMPQCLAQCNSSAESVYLCHNCFGLESNRIVESKCQQPFLIVLVSMKELSDKAFCIDAPFDNTDIQRNLIQFYLLRIQNNAFLWLISDKLYSMRIFLNTFASLFHLIWLFIRLLNFRTITLSMVHFWVGLLGIFWQPKEHTHRSEINISKSSLKSNECLENFHF